MVLQDGQSAGLHRMTMHAGNPFYVNEPTRRYELALVEFRSSCLQRTFYEIHVREQTFGFFTARGSVTFSHRECRLLIRFLRKTNILNSSVSETLFADGERRLSLTITSGTVFIRQEFENESDLLEISVSTVPQFLRKLEKQCTALEDRLVLLQ